MIKALRAIIHDKASVKEANDSIRTGENQEVKNLSNNLLRLFLYMTT